LFLKNLEIKLIKVLWNLLHVAIAAATIIIIIIIFESIIKIVAKRAKPRNNRWS
jgi:hypothetical protein